MGKIDRKEIWIDDCDIGDVEIYVTEQFDTIEYFNASLLDNPKWLSAKGLQKITDNKCNCVRCGGVNIESYYKD